MAPAVKAPSPKHQTTREFPFILILISISLITNDTECLFVLTYLSSVKGLFRFLPISHRLSFYIITLQQFLTRIQFLCQIGSANIFFLSGIYLLIIVARYLTVALTWISLTSNDNWASFHMLLTIHVSSLFVCLIQVFAHFFSWVVCLIIEW